MFRFEPAGFLWLFAHEARLLWRGSILLRTRRHILLPIILTGALFQSGALALAWVARSESLPAATLVMIANLNLFFLLFLMLSRAMTLAIDVLYSRGDVDVLLASPMPPSRVLAVRMLGVAASTASPWLLLGGVLANALLIFGHPAALAIYPTIVAVSLLATAIAFASIVSLVAQVGPRIARSISHGLALFIGLAIFILGQLPRFIPAHAISQLWRTFLPTPDNAYSFIWLPGRGLIGQPAPLLATGAISIAVFTAILFGLAGKFASGAVSAAALTHGPVSQRTKNQFPKTPFAAATRKNLRLLIRFPGLATQTIYRSLTLVPVAIILTGHIEIGASTTIVIPLTIFLAGQLALFFGSIIVTTDQSPELAASAPVPPTLSSRTTAAAAFTATAAIILLPIIAISLREASLAPIAAIFAIAAALSNLALAQKFPIPLSRPRFGKQQIGTLFGLVLGVAVSAVWSLAAWLLMHHWVGLGGAA